MNSFAQTEKRGPIIGQEEIEDEVHGFSSDATHGLAQHKKKHSHHHKNKKHHKKHKKDVAERGMDEEVHGFTSTNLPPLNEWERSDTPYAYNGGEAHDSSLHQRGHKKHHKHRNVGETKMDEEVHGFTAHNTSPIAEERRSAQPHVANGSDASAHESSLHQSRTHKHHKHHKRDIAERGMDEEVHGFTTAHLPPLNEWERRETPYDANGSDPSAHDSSLH